MADESKKYITKDYSEFNLVALGSSVKNLSAETKTYYVFSTSGGISITAPPLQV